MKFNRYILSLLMLFAIIPSTSARKYHPSEDDEYPPLYDPRPATKYEIYVGTGLKLGWYHSFIPRMWDEFNAKQLYESSRNDKYSNIILGFSYNLKDKWDLCFDVDFTYLDYQYVDPFTLAEIESDKTFGLGLYCGARYNWVYRKGVRVYSQLSGGFLIHGKSTIWDKEMEGARYPFLVLQPTIIGFSFGKHLSISYNLGLMGHMNKCSMCLGYKF